jgi:hypothetical protein
MTVEEGRIFIIPLDAIGISEEHKAQKFTQTVWDRYEWQYVKSGLANADIVLDKNNTLVDGYIWYMIAKHYELTAVPVRYTNT